MNRRNFVHLAAGLLVAIPAAHAQTRKKARLAVLLHTNPEGTRHLLAAFIDRLAELGWTEGKNVEFLVRYAEGDAGRHAPLVAEVLAQKPDVIYASFGPFALAAKKQTAELPIVFSMVDDPVAMGLAATLARPGGNVTGVTTRGRELAGKRLEILREVVPSLRRIGVTGLVSTPEHRAILDEVGRAAGKLGVEVVEAVKAQWALSDHAALGPAIAELVRHRVDALLGLTYLIYPLHREFVQQVAHAKLPAIYDAEEFVQAGGLMSLSVSFIDRFREAANYVDRILRGAKPADLPVQEPMRFAFTVNLKTAKALGLRIPQSVLARADRVIE